MKLIEDFFNKYVENNNGDYIESKDIFLYGDHYWEFKDKKEKRHFCFKETEVTPKNGVDSVYFFYGDSWKYKIGDKAVLMEKNKEIISGISVYKFANGDYSAETKPNWEKLYRDGKSVSGLINTSFLYSHDDEWEYTDMAGVVHKFKHKIKGGKNEK